MSDDLNSSLDYLWEMLTNQGLYMEANIVALAQNRIDELEAKSRKRFSRLDFAAIKYVRADRIEELEAKLAKAVDALVQIVGKKYYADDPWGIANATLAELKGENDE
jgi:isocitrate dehydrogenase kinase/phosphatase